jgi:alpha-1,3-mannosyltransferase
MRITHIVRQYHPSVGGLEDAVANLCGELIKIEGVEINIVTLNRLFSDTQTILPSHEVINDIPVRRIPYVGSSRYPMASHKVLKLFETADLVHVHAIDFFFDFLALTKLYHGKPMVASTHGGFFHTEFAARLKKIYFQTATRFSCLAYKTICASSDQDAATFKRIAPSKVVTIENGVNIEKWYDAGSKILQRHLITIGRWSENKRIPLLIDLMTYLKTQHPGWHLTICGVAGSETVASLKQHIRLRSIEDHVSIFEKPDNNQLKSHIGKASYIASASAYEGFGLTAIEGLSAGLIPLLSPLAPFQKLLDQLSCGIVFQPDDLEKTAKALESAHNRYSQNYQSCRQECLALAQNYAWPATAQRFYDVYHSILNR